MNKKMYKSGKLWITAGFAGATLFGVTGFLNEVDAQANTIDPASKQQGNSNDVIEQPTVDFRSATQKESLNKNEVISDSDSLVDSANIRSLEFEPLNSMAQPLRAFDEEQIKGHTAFRMTDDEILSMMSVIESQMASDSIIISQLESAQESGIILMSQLNSQTLSTNNSIDDSITESEDKSTKDSEDESTSIEESQDKSTSIEDSQDKSTSIENSENNSMTDSVLESQEDLADSMVATENVLPATGIAQNAEVNAALAAGLGLSAMGLFGLKRKREQDK